MTLMNSGSNDDLAGASSTADTRWFARADLVGRWIENILLIVLMAGLVLVAGGQILLRNAFSIALPWADGLVRIGVLWIALIGAVAASRDHKHIAIEVAARLLPARARRVAEVLRLLVTAVVCGLLAWFSFQFVADSYTYADVLLGRYPAWWFQTILPVGFALIAYRYTVRMIQACLTRP